MLKQFFCINDTLYCFLITCLLLDTINFTRSGICLSEVPLFPLCFRLDAALLHFRHPLLIIFLCFCKNLGLSAAGACDNTMVHPGLIATATPAVQFNSLLELCTFLVLSHGHFCLARLCLGTGRILHEETLAGDYLAGNVLDLLTFVSGRLHSREDNWKHLALIGPSEIVGG